MRSKTGVTFNICPPLKDCKLIERSSNPTSVRLQTHRSAVTLKALTGEMNNIDYLLTLAPVTGLEIQYIRQQVNSQVLK